MKFLGTCPREDWYNAVRYEDCFRLHMLLETHPRLVLEGWEDDPTLGYLAGESLERGLERGSDGGWKGRTALHAAATRGSVKLVEKIVKLFNIEHDGEWFVENPVTLVEPSSNPTSDSREGESSLTSDVKTAENRSLRENLTSDVKTARENRSLGESPTPSKLNGGLSTSYEEKVEPPCVVESSTSEEMKDDTRSNHLKVKTRSLAALLTMKDSLFEVEALAMAAINGNAALIDALLSASLKCKSDPYHVGGKSPGTTVSKSGLRAARELERITAEVMGSLSPDARDTVLSHYSQDAVLKAWPWQQYLLQFALSTPALGKDLSKRIQNEMMMKVIRFGTKDFLARRELGRLISEYPDGPGINVVSQVAQEQPLGEEVNPSLVLGVEGVQDMVLGGPQEEVIARLEVVRKVTEEVMTSLSLVERITMVKVYYEDVYFNFLPIEEYLFHFTFTGKSELGEKIRREFLERIDSMDGDDNSMKYRRFAMLELQDGRGRTAMHVAVAASGDKMITEYLHLVPAGEEHQDWVNVRDGAGRTALHCAVADRVGDRVVKALLKDSRVDLNAVWNTCKATRWLYRLLERHGLAREMFRSTRSGERGSDSSLQAIHIAIIWERLNCVKLLLADDHKERKEEFRLDLTKDVMYLQPLAFATFIGNTEVVKLLLKDERAQDSGRPLKWWAKQKLNHSKIHHAEGALHIAAAHGRFNVLKCFLDMNEMEKLYDPFVTRRHAKRASRERVVNTNRERGVLGMTAMHFVTNWENGGQFDLNLLQCFTDHDIKNLFEIQKVSKDDAEINKKRLAERKGCVELLLQAGLDVWTTDVNNQAPYPSSNAPSDFFSWWYEKLSKETTEEHNTLNAAANAISVTATLVATTSYVGPLQPPLGYKMDSEGLPVEIQVQNIWVRIFIVCDNLSFYLAVASIMLAVLPMLPIPRQSVRMEIKHTRRIVMFAVGVLFPSIISILMAFTASSMAVIPSDHAGLKKSTIVFGGVFCLLVIYLFSIRILGLVFDKNSGLKKLYGKSIFFDENILTAWRGSAMDKKVKECTGPLVKKWTEFPVGKMFMTWRIPKWMQKFKKEIK